MVDRGCVTAPLPNHDNSEVQDVPGVPEVGCRMEDEAKGDDPHAALRGEDDGKNDLNLFQKVVGGIAVPIGEGGEDSERYAGTQDC